MTEAQAERAFHREFTKINKKFLVDEINMIARTKFTPSPIAPPESAQDYLQLRYLFQNTFGYELANGKNQPSCLCLVVDKKGKR